MKKVVLVFGILSGLVASLMMFLTMPLVHNGTINFKNGYLVGYTTIFLSMMFVFFGIRAYRENAGGTMSFGRGVAVGLLITLISCAFYVASWEVLYFNFMPDFMDQYSAFEIGQMHEKGASAAAVAAKEKELAQMKEWYKNPFVNVAMTFIEPFPVGLVVTLVSAGFLRRRTPRLPAGVAAQAV